MNQKIKGFLFRIFGLSSNNSQLSRNLPRDDTVRPGATSLNNIRSSPRVEWISETNNQLNGIQNPDSDASGELLVRLARLLGNRSGASKAYEFYQEVRKDYPSAQLREICVILEGLPDSSWSPREVARFLIAGDVSRNQSNGSVILPEKRHQEKKLIGVEWGQDTRKLSSNIIGLVDPVQQTPIKPGETIAQCENCQTVYHYDTWKSIFAKRMRWVLLQLQ